MKTNFLQFAICCLFVVLVVGFVVVPVGHALGAVVSTLTSALSVPHAN